MLAKELAKGDTVRIIQRKSPEKLGETLWEITSVGPGPFQVEMREANTDYRPQQFDTSLLKRAK